MHPVLSSSIHQNPVFAIEDLLQDYQWHVLARKTSKHHPPARQLSSRKRSVCHVKGESYVKEGGYMKEGGYVKEGSCMKEGSNMKVGG